MKRCRVCTIVKPITDFNRDPGKALGRRSLCRVCDGLLRKANYWKNHDREHKKWLSRPDRQRKSRPWTKPIDPVKNSARRRLRKAVKDGRISKPTQCQLCGNHAEGRSLSGHHSDYSKPFDVEWLCSRCHGITHRKYVEALK